MKLKRKLAVIVAILAAFQLLHSFPPGHGPDGGLRLFQYIFQRNLFDGRLILKYREEIGLTASQEKKVEDLLLSVEESFIKRNAAIKIKELRFASAIKSDRTDRRQVEKLLRGISQDKTDLFIDYLNYLFDLKELLTPKQVEKLQEIKNRYKKNHTSTRK